MLATISWFQGNTRILQSCMRLSLQRWINNQNKPKITLSSQVKSNSQLSTPVIKSLSLPVRDWWWWVLPSWGHLHHGTITQINLAALKMHPRRFSLDIYMQLLMDASLNVMGHLLRYFQNKSLHNPLSAWQHISSCHLWLAVKPRLFLLCNMLFSDTSDWVRQKTQSFLFIGNKCAGCWSFFR